MLVRSHDAPPLSFGSRNSGDDVVIVGGGIAGLFCALALAPRPVTLVTAAPLGDGAATGWAQGGIAAAVAIGDTPEAHARDTVAAGAGLVDERIALALAREAPARIADLVRQGVPFDRDGDGRLAVGREAAHSARRIVHAGGDTTGRAIMAALTAAVARTPTIRVLAGAVAEDLTVDRGAVTGVWARIRAGASDRRITVPARAVVLASGGLGGLYAVTTNPPLACGTGLAIAARAGAVCADAEFVQFHPTAIAIGRDPAPLATEALRGEGAILVNAAGERFMAARHPDGELAPRDVVARGVFGEIAAGRGAFLDATQAIGRTFPQRFPTVHTACMLAGVDPVRQPIPIAPAAHYHMGGVVTDATGRTSLDGLWAAGEVAATGLHGANRLASNSLLEGVVYAARVAADIDGLAPARSAPGSATVVDAAPAAATAGADIAVLRALMSADVGVERTADGLARALDRIVRIERAAATPTLRNMATAALLVAAAAWHRRESRGAHLRTDHPDTDPAQAKRAFLTLADARAIADAAIGVTAAVA